MNTLKITAIFLVFTCVFSTLKTHSHQELKSSLKSLKESNFGKEVFTAIALELESNGVHDEALTTVLEMLYNMRDGLFGYWQVDGASVQEKKAIFNNQQAELEASIQKLEIKLLDAADLVFDLQDDVEDKQQEEVDANQAVADAEQKQMAVQAENLQKKAEFNESQAAHDDMIAVFQQCKTVVSQLASSFLQKGDTKVFDKNLKSVVETANKLTSDKNIKLASKLIQMSSSQEIQSDQSQVSDIIEILDALIAAEQETKKNEYWLEEKRLDLVDLKMETLQKKIDGLSAVMLEINADMKGLDVKINELSRDSETWGVMIEQKSEYLSDLSQDHSEEVASLENSVDNMHGQIELLNDVISILENEPLEEVQEAVEEVNNE